METSGKGKGNQNCKLTTDLNTDTEMFLQINFNKLISSKKFKRNKDSKTNNQDRM